MAKNLQVLQAKATEVAVPEQGTAVLMRLIERAATSSDFDVAKLDKLLDVREKWEKTEARKAFDVAMNGFKANPPDIEKTKLVSFGQTKYYHATLDDVCKAVSAAMSPHGLSFRWDIQQREHGAITVSCILAHVGGHSEMVSMSATADTSGQKNPIQAIGSAISYLERYTLMAATGLAARDMDDDGIASGQRNEPRPQRPTSKPNQHDQEPEDLGLSTIGVPLKGDQPNWKGFGGQFIARLKTAKNADEIMEFVAANGAALASCEQNGPKAHKSILAAIEAQKKAVAPAKAASPPQAEAAPQTPTEAPKATQAPTAAPERPTLASFSPFKPGVKGTNEAWVKWADAFLIELAATPTGAIKAFLECWKRELTYVKAYSADLGNIWDKLAKAIEQNRA